MGLGKLEEVADLEVRTARGNAEYAVVVKVETERERLIEKYRHEMIPAAGIAIFIFGNKTDGDSVINSDGMLKEFKAAQELGIPCLAIGCKRGASKRIASKVLAQMNEISSGALDSVKEFTDLEFQESLARLNKPGTNLGDALKITVALCKKLRG